MAAKEAMARLDTSAKYRYLATTRYGRGPTLRDFVRRLPWQ